MKNKKTKTEIKDETVSFNPFVASTADKIKAIKTKTDTEAAKHSISLSVNEDLIIKFEELLNSFKGVTKAFFTYPSKVQLFETGCHFLKEHLSKKKQYKIAPEQFIKYIGRKGKRPSSPEHEIRKGNAKPLYLTVDNEVYDIYYNLIYSFLIKKDDIANPYYSSAYYFKDFIELLTDNFDALCKYEIRNPKS